MNKTINKKISLLAIEHPIERKLLIALSAVFAVLLFAYFYFVVGSVLNVIARKEADAQAAQVEGSIGTLETQYFALSQSVTPASAQALGLAPVSATQYVDRPGNAAVAGEPHASAI